MKSTIKSLSCVVTGLALMAVVAQSASAYVLYSENFDGVPVGTKLTELVPPFSESNPASEGGGTATVSNVIEFGSQGYDARVDATGRHIIPFIGVPAPVPGGLWEASVDMLVHSESGQGNQQFQLKGNLGPNGSGRWGEIVWSGTSWRADLRDPNGDIVTNGTLKEGLTTDIFNLKFVVDPANNEYWALVDNSMSVKVGFDPNDLPEFNELVLFDFEGGTQAAFDNLLVTGVPEPTTVERSWRNDDSGSWLDVYNWVGGPPPNSNDRVAILGTAISSPKTVFIDTTATVKGIQFTSPHTYAVAGPGNLNLEADSGNASIDVQSGTHQFQVAVNLNSETDLSADSDASIAFQNVLNLNGNNLNTSGSGTISINNRTNAGGGTVNVASGTVGGDGTIGGDVDNSGGTVSPGNSPGTLTIDGNYNQGSGGTLAIEIGGTQAGVNHDVLDVLGDASLAGTLSVSLIDGFTPSGGDTFKVLTAAGELTDLGLTLGGSAAASFTMSVDTTNDWIMLMTAGAGLVGDYNGNGIVDAADYTLFRDNLGGDSAVLNGNGSGAATVVQADYDLWKQNFGSSGTGSSAAVPEPCSYVLMTLGLLALGACRGRQKPQ